jgi:RimJ/RimL family protein N-acetyltransferase
MRLIPERSAARRETNGTSHPIRTARLELRVWKESDLAPFAAMNADPAVMQYFPSELTRAESDALAGRISRHIQAYGFGLWAVERREDGAFVGFVGLAHTRFSSHFTPCIDLGWRLARHYWGKGYATEAASAAAQYGFDQLGLREIVAFTVPENRRSRGVMERIGMRHDASGDFEHPHVDEGHHLRRHVLYRLVSG